MSTALTYPRLSNQASSMFHASLTDFFVLSVVLLKAQPAQAGTPEETVCLIHALMRSALIVSNVHSSDEELWARSFDEYDELD